MGKPFNLKLSPHYGIRISDRGIAPYLESPAGKIHAGLMALPSPIQGMTFTFGRKTAPVFMKLANMVIANKLKELEGKPKPQYPARKPRPNGK
jgi:hypothetical protein